MNPIIELINKLEELSIEEIEQQRDEFIAEFGDSENHIIEDICGMVIHKKQQAGAAV